MNTCLTVNFLAIPINGWILWQVLTRTDTTTPAFGFLVTVFSLRIAIAAIAVLRFPKHKCKPMCGICGEKR